MDNDIILRDIYSEDFQILKKELVEKLEKYFNCYADYDQFFEITRIRLSKVNICMSLSSRQIEALYHTNIQKNYRGNRDDCKYYAKKETIEEIIRQVENRFIEEFKKMMRRMDNDF
jgi:hypothetical protein